MKPFQEFVSRWHSDGGGYNLMPRHEIIFQKTRPVSGVCTPKCLLWAHKGLEIDQSTEWKLHLCSQILAVSGMMSDCSNNHITTKRVHQYYRIFDSHNGRVYIYMNVCATSVTSREICRTVNDNDDNNNNNNNIPAANSTSPEGCTRYTFFLRAFHTHMYIRSCLRQVSCV